MVRYIIVYFTIGYQLLPDFILSFIMVSILLLNLYDFCAPDNKHWRIIVLSVYECVHAINLNSVHLLVFLDQTHLLLNINVNTINLFT